MYVYARMDGLMDGWMSQIILAYHVRVPAGEVTLDRNELAAFRTVPLGRLKPFPGPTGAAVGGNETILFFPFLSPPSFVFLPSLLSLFSLSHTHAHSLTSLSLLFFCFRWCVFTMLSEFLKRRAKQLRSSL